MFQTRKARLNNRLDPTGDSLVHFLLPAIRPGQPYRWADPDTRWYTMTDSGYKKFTAQAKAAIKGEAFFEALVSDYSLPHHIVGSKDLGIDYICEWVYGDQPTGVLYAVQVKTLSRQNVQLEDLGPKLGYNQLRRYEIRNAVLQIDERTLQYWRGLGMPVYLFVIVYCESQGQGGRFESYYKRFTSVLTTHKTQDKEDFYLVSEGTTFRAFADQTAQTNGFARDLFVDLMRCYYSKGSISYISPRTIGLQQFPEENAVFQGVIEEYRQSICSTYQKTKRFIETLCENYSGDSSDQETFAVPSAEAPKDDIP